MKICQTVSGVEQKALIIHVGQHLAQHLEDRDNNEQREKDVQLIGPRSFGFVERKSASAVAGVCHRCHSLFSAQFQRSVKIRAAQMRRPISFKST